MSNTIWKYKLDVDDIVELDMPREADVLTVNTQEDWPCLWVAVDKSAPLVKRCFVVHGTGHAIENYEKKKFLGTFFMDIGLVFHVFELLDS